MANESVPVAKPKKKRSPTYPGINLQQAIKRATEFYEKEHRNPASFRAAVSHWDYSEKSSGALVTAAALKSFGLLDEIDSSVGRMFQISPLGLKIVADKRPESNERDAAIREAALRPKIHAELWRKYNGRLPSDAELQYQLENEWNFNLNAIVPFIKELRETILFAKITESDKVGELKEDEPEEEEVKIGDYVQWVSQGSEQFTILKKVIAFSPDGRFAHLEGEKTGVPVAELEVGEAPIDSPPPARPRYKKAVEGARNMRNEVYSLESSGEEIVITWPHPLPSAEAADIKDWLKIVERKLARSAAEGAKPQDPEKP